MPTRMSLAVELMGELRGGCEAAAAAACVGASAGGPTSSAARGRLPADEVQMSLRDSLKQSGYSPQVRSTPFASTAAAATATTTTAALDAATPHHHQPPSPA